MSLGRPPKDQSREASDTSCGRGTGEDKTRSSATCTEGRGCKGPSFRGILCLQNFYRFLPTADDTHTSTSQHEASRETQEQRSNLWACHCRTSIALLRNHNNSGCCSGYEPARGEAPGHYNNLPNLYATVSFREMSRAFPIKFTSR